MKNKNEIKNIENTVDKEKILKQFESGEIKIALTEEQKKQLYDSLEFKQSRAEYEFINNALLKQIPKKVGKIGKRKGIGMCVICGCAVQKNEKYCLRCGQRLDWSD